jgi:mannose-6-phosphate isomerase
VAQALEAIDYALGPLKLQSPQPVERPHVERLVECDKFVLDRWRFDQPQPIGGDGRFHLVTVLDGAVQTAGDPTGHPLSKGQTMLVPAAVGRCQLTPEQPTTLLDIYLP